MLLYNIIPKKARGFFNSVIFSDQSLNLTPKSRTRSTACAISMIIPCKEKLSIDNDEI